MTDLTRPVPVPTTSSPKLVHFASIIDRNCTNFGWVGLGMTKEKDPR